MQPPTIDEYIQGLEGHDYWGFYYKQGVRTSFEELNKIYGNTYARRMPHIELTQNAREVLMALRKNGCVCGLVSTQIAELADPLFVRFNLAHYFKYVSYPVTAKAEKIKEILEQENCAPQQCLYIGDTPSDVRSAHEAGVVAVAYLNGYIRKSLLDAAQPDHTIRDLKEILRIVEGH